jgi:predicted transcriptional regulator
MMMMASRSKTVYIKDGETFTEWLRRELKDQLSNRYKIVHLAEDMGVPNITLYRFLHGKEVRTPFYDSAFKYLIKK